MCDTVMNNHLQELARLRCMRAELDQLIEAEETAIKTHMESTGQTEIIGIEHKAMYKSVTSSRLDSTALKRELPEIAARFMRTSSSMRFTFA